MDNLSMKSPDVQVPSDMYRKFFQSMPTFGYVVDKQMKIVEITDSLLSEFGYSREKILGVDVLEAWPDNPEDPEANGTEVLRSSLERAFATGAPETLPRQRYDVQPESGGPFEVRYWLPQNIPVKDENDEVCYVLHTVVDDR